MVRSLDFHGLPLLENLIGVSMLHWIWAKGWNLGLIINGNSTIARLGPWHPPDRSIRVLEGEQRAGR